MSHYSNFYTSVLFVILNQQNNQRHRALGMWLPGRAICTPCGNSPKIRKAQNVGCHFCIEALLVNPELLMILWKKQSEILPRTVINIILVIFN